MKSLSFTSKTVGAALFSLFSLTACDAPSSTAEQTHNEQATNTNDTKVEDDFIHKNQLPDDAPTYIVATDSDFPPFSFRADNGKATGYDVDLITAIGNHAGFKVNIIIADWKKWPEALEDGSVDIWAAGIAIQEYRKNLVSYSNPYLGYGTGALARNDEKSQNITKDNLKDYRLLALNGTVDLEFIQTLKQDKPEEANGVKTNYLGIKAISNHEADVLISNDKVLKYHTTLPQNKNFHVIDLDDEQDPNKMLGFTVKKGRQELVDKINEGLEAVKQDGTYQKINEKWFGSDN